MVCVPVSWKQTTYDTLDRAQNACSEDKHCKGVKDFSCDHVKFVRCYEIHHMGESAYELKRDCVFLKEGNKITSGQML